MDFNLDKFIHTGTFLDTIIDSGWLRENCDDISGEDIRIYYFYQDDFTVSFVYDESLNQLMAEQVEIPRTGTLEGFTDYDKFVNKYDAAIMNIYGDKDETVLFMKNEVNVHFDKLLTKITSKSDAARDLVIRIMDKIR